MSPFTKRPRRRERRRTRHTKPNKSKFILTARKDGQPHFFDSGKDRKKNHRFQMALLAGQTVSNMASIAGISGAFLLKSRSSFSLFSLGFDAKHLAQLPCSIQGLATIFQKKRKGIID